MMEVSDRSNEYLLSHELFSRLPDLILEYMKENNEKIRELHEEIREKIERINELERKLKEHEHMHKLKIIQEIDNKYTELIDKFNDVKEQIENLINSINDTVIPISNLVNQLSELNKKLINIEQKINIQDFTGRITNLEEILENIQRLDIGKISEELEKIDSLISQIDATRIQREKLADVYNDIIDSIEKLKKSIYEFNGSVSYIKNSIEDFMKTYGDFNNKIKEALNYTDKLNNEINHVINQISNGLYNLISMYDDLKRNFLENIKQDIETIIDKIDKVSEKIDIRITSKIMSIEAETDNLLKKIVEKEEELDKNLDKINERVVNIDQVFDEKIDKINRILDEVIESHKSRLDEIKRKIKELEENKSKLEKELIKYREKYEIYMDFERMVSGPALVIIEQSLYIIMGILGAILKMAEENRILTPEQREKIRRYIEKLENVLDTRNPIDKIKLIIESAKFFIREMEYVGRTIEKYSPLTIYKVLWKLVYNFNVSLANIQL